MATVKNSTTAEQTSLPGYQRFTIEITDAEAALLRAEAAEQDAFSREWSERNGFPARPELSLADAASNLLSQVLRKNAARQEGGAQ